MKKQIVNQLINTLRTLTVPEQIEAAIKSKQDRHDEVQRLERERDEAYDEIPRRIQKREKPWYEAELEPSAWKRGN